MAFNYADKLRLRLYGGCLLTQPPQHFKIEMLLEKINFEMQYISKLSFCPKMRFSAEPAARRAALLCSVRAFKLFKIEMLWCRCALKTHIFRT